MFCMMYNSLMYNSYCQGSGRKVEQVVSRTLPVHIYLTNFLVNKLKKAVLQSKFNFFKWCPICVLVEMFL